MKNRKTLLLFLGVVLAIFAVVSTSSAQSIDGSGWWTSFTMQNASTSGNATLVATAYHETDNPSTDTFSGSAVLGPSNSSTFHPGLAGNCDAPPTVAANGCRIALSPDLDPGFEGSVVISSDAPVVSFVSLNNNTSGSVGVGGGTARSAYDGVSGSDTATTLYFPSFKYAFAGNTSVFYVQAVGGDTSVTMTYTTQEGTPVTYTETKTILENRTYAFHPAAAGVPSCNGAANDNCRGGAIATVNSGGTIAGTAVEFADGASVAQFVMATGAITPANTGTKILIPSAKDAWNGQTTGIAILNTTGTQATADLTYTVKGVSTLSGTCSVNVGDVETNSVNVPANGTTVVRTTAGNTPFPSNCSVFYSVVIDDQGADQNLAATVNQSETKNGQKLLAKYAGFNAGSATETVLFPSVKDLFGNNTHGISIVNAGSTATSATVTYQGSSTHVLQTVSIAPGASITLRNVSGGDSDIASIVSGGLPVAGQKYAVTVVSDTGGVNLVGFAQQASTAGTTLDVNNYEGFNQ